MKYVIASPTGEISIFEICNNTDHNDNDYTSDPLDEGEFYSWALFGRYSSREKWSAVRLFKTKKEADSKTAYHRDFDYNYCEYNWSCSTKVLGILKEFNTNDT
jgi:hypothetical protein